MTLSKSELEEPYNIDKEISFVVQLMWYATKVGPDVANTASELAVHMSHIGQENYRSLGRLIGYLRGKYTKGIIIGNAKVLKYVIFANSNYAKDKDTRKSVSRLVVTLGGTLMTCSSNTQRLVTLITTEAEYVAVSACTQEVKFISMLHEK